MENAAPSPDRPLVEVIHGAKTYQTGRTAVEAVRDVSFAVGPREFVSLLGPSGCGKSTVLMALAGLDILSKGELFFDGEPVMKPRTDIGVIFQDATLLPWKSALENVLYPIRILRRPVSQYRERAIGLLREVGLGDFLDQTPRQLSGGMRQRVAICRALVYDPRLLLMDEPFSALDAITRDEMNLLLLDIWQRVHKSAVFVTHSIREAVLLSDRVLVMSHRPSTILADIAIPFARPRDASIVDAPEFNAICAELRSLIHKATTMRSAA